MKKLSLFISAILLLCSVFPASAAVTNSYTAVNTETVNLRWSEKFGTSYRDAPGVPAVCGDNIIILSGNTIYKLDKTNGSVISTAQLSSTVGFGYIPPLYEDGILYCALDNSVIEAYDLDTMARLWTYADETDGQSLAPIVYDEGCIYTGFWYDEETAGNFVCLNALTGEKIWSFSHLGGFYWAGCAVCGDYLVLGGDDGTYDYESQSNVYCLNKLTGEVADSLEIVGDQRSSVVYDENTESFYFTTKAGYLYSVKMADGVLYDLQTVNLGGSSTSTPVIYNNCAYVGAQGSLYSGYVLCVDLTDFTVKYTAEMPGYPQTELVLREVGDTLYVYAVCNNSTGGIVFFTEKNGVQASDAEYLFTPPSGQTGYSVSRLIVDEDGTFYYKNDSCYVFAVENSAAEPINFINRLLQFFNKILAVLDRVYSTL
ncbi:MAG: PQQ-binding-like beta-propeller repeat protein [Clostridiales bacterium]|nr:PQQ-binding-like beta-propeller repeat protein [Clostridiales bacterium]